MRGLNAAGRLAKGFFAPDAEAWWAAAEKGSPGKATPSAEMRAAMDVLVDALREEGRLNLIGRFAAKDDTVRMARTALRVEDCLRAFPAARSTEWPEPVFIVGLPRTGTTSLHHLLAADPNHRTMPYWESFDPVPPREGQADQRAAKVDAMLRQLEGLAPDYHAIHPMTAEGPEECVALFMNALRTLQFGFQYRVPSYEKWLLEQDARIAYRAYQDQLRLVQFFRPTGRRFVLKDPIHLVHLDTVVELFPNAKIIFTHRDPGSSLSSLCSLISHTRAIFSDEVDPLEVGRDVLDGPWPRAVESAMSIRAGLAPEQYVDVRQADLAADPMKVAESIYRTFGWDFEDQTRNALLAKVESGPRAATGRHLHQPEGFGLTAAALRARLSDYAEDFDL